MSESITIKSTELSSLMNRVKFDIMKNNFIFQSLLDDYKAYKCLTDQYIKKELEENQSFKHFYDFIQQRQKEGFTNKLEKSKYNFFVRKLNREINNEMYSFLNSSNKLNHLDLLIMVEEQEIIAKCLSTEFDFNLRAFCIGNNVNNTMIKIQKDIGEYINNFHGISKLV